MEHNTTGPPWSVGRPRARPARSVTDDDDKRQQAKQYWPIMWASHNGCGSADTRFVVLNLLYYSKYLHFTSTIK